MKDEKSSAGEKPQFAYDVVAKVDRKHFWYIVRNERVLNLIKQSFDNWSNISFLEVGCGTGNVIGYLYEHGMKNVTGYDRNPTALELCRSRYPDINFVEHDFTLQYDKTEIYDLVGLFDVLEHLPDENAALLEVRKHIAPGGKFICTVPAHKLLWSAMDEIYGHKKRYSKEELRAALEKGGFKDIRIAYFMAPLAPLVYLRRRFMQTPGELTIDETRQILKRDARYPGDFLNAIMLHTLRWEHQILGMQDINFGGSIIAMCSI